MGARLVDVYMNIWLSASIVICVGVIYDDVYIMYDDINQFCVSGVGHLCAIGAA